MSELPINSTYLFLLGIHFLNGAIAAIVAQQKGYPLVKWLLIGSIGGTFALVLSLLLKSTLSNQKENQK